MAESSTCPDAGTYSERLTDVDFSGRPCLFLDRDGVLVEETNYLHRPEDVAFIPKVLPAIAEVNKRGIPVVIVTNQAGVGRGYYDWAEFHRVQRHILHVCQS